MTIHKEGRGFLLKLIIVLAVLGVLGHWIFKNNLTFAYILDGLFVFIFLFFLQFFRSPKVDFQLEENTILCPADGKVVVIEKTKETEYLKDERIQISIFMSPLNVHVNRNPVSGTFEYYKYHAGKFLVAWHPKSSTENERTTVVISHKKAKILFRQIAGAVARRIVCYAKVGDEAEQGQDFGFIKLGSRVDVFLPLDAEVLVDINQVVKGGITHIAKLK